VVVPGLAVSLFSVRVATRLGYHVTFKAELLGVYRGSELILDGHRSGNIYLLREEVAELGVATAAVPAAVTGMDVTAVELRRLATATCEPCIRGKMMRLPFKESETVVDEPLDLVHTDVNGPMTIPTPSGDRFEVVMVDHKSKYKVVVPVKSKGEATNVVMNVINRWETQLGRKAKVVRRDGGKECTGAKFDKWRSDKGIVVQTTTRYTPEQNGVAERYNRTLGERVTAVLADSNLPRKWWGEAALAVTYVANRTPSRGKTKTPHELFFVKKPDVGHLRAFGCRVWAHVPHQVRRKMGDKAKPGTFMGYAEDTKGYKVLINGRITSRRRGGGGPLWRNSTWELVDLPVGAKVTGTQMLCERKRGADGSVSHYKGRYVALGDTQVHLVDYGEVWAPVARHSTLRAVLSATAWRGWALCQLDVETAFLNGVVEEEVYVRQPSGYERGDRGKVFRLLKALYGLKQASRAWYKKLTAILRAAGMRATNADPCLFVGTFDAVRVYVLVYVDDLLLAGESGTAVNMCKKVLTNAFTVRDMGLPTYFLGMHVDHDRAAGKLSLGQRQYVTTILERFALADCNPVRLPMGVGVVMQREGATLDVLMATKYQEAVGALLYLATCTRPDISFTVGKLSRHVSAPTQAHWAAGKAVMRYLKGTRTWCLTYGSEGPLVGYSDADYAGDIDTRRSTTGQAFLWGGAAISWGSKIQATVAASTTETEYVAAVMAAKEALWLRRLVRELGGDDKPVVMHCDSQGAMAMMHNPTNSNRTKHIDVTHHFVRECVETAAISVTQVGTADMVADCLTKALPTDAFNKCRAALGLTDGEADAARVGVLAPVHKADRALDAGGSDGQAGARADVAPGAAATAAAQC